MSEKASGWSKIYEVVRCVPKGLVTTYGQIATLSDFGTARHVGWALNALSPEDDVPWHRVINARGEISRRAERGIEDLQRSLLETEGVDFDRRGRVDLDLYRWKPRSRPSSEGGSPRGAETHAKVASTGKRKGGMGTR